MKIDRIKRDKEYLYVERQWIEDSPCITVVFRCKEDVESEKISYRAFFFDKDKKQIFELKEYTSWSTGAGDLKRLPFQIKGGDATEIYFGIPERLKNDWHRVVVVLEIKGNAESRVMEIYPTDKMSDYPVPVK
ncbi:MAG: hypothetical protein H7A52_06695 [Akkermansiaceae bacterium]|nr:hypothetical protein [Akkermansiaceae bacterium]